MVGPGFRNAGDPQPSDFARLAALDFDHLLSAHGPALIGGAKAALQAIFATFGV